MHFISEILIHSLSHTMAGYIRSKNISQYTAVVAIQCELFGDSGPVISHSLCQRIPVILKEDEYGKYYFMNINEHNIVDGWLDSITIEKDNKKKIARRGFSSKYYKFKDIYNSRHIYLEDNTRLEFKKVKTSL